MNVIALHLPPLRDRGEDVPLFAKYFLDRAAAANPDSGPFSLSDETMDALLAYDWPGNVRELENALERAVVVAEGSGILPEHLPERITDRPDSEVGG